MKSIIVFYTYVQLIGQYVPKNYDHHTLKTGHINRQEIDSTPEV